MNRDAVFALIEAERGRQSDLWNRDHSWGNGDCSSQDVGPLVKAAVLSEEAGEVSRAVLDMNNYQLRTELVQVAAVAVAWLEGLPA